ncbi:MAG TPA: hypothetical protein ENK32_06945 [Anaerolineae bacterium]|nr:hypothetical protein [Anaerolineae bacterium]
MGSKDIGGKYLIDRDPESWIRWLLKDDSLEVVKVLSPEFQFVTRRTDSIMQVIDRDGPFIALAELQLHFDRGMPARLQNYTAMARQKYGLNVVPVVLFLTEPPPGAEIQTCYHTEFRGLVTHQDFVVIKLWEMDAKETLRRPAPAGLLPYVPLMANADEDVVRECVRRIRWEPDHEELETILALFAMIKFDPERIIKIVRWHMTVLERSPIYQEILEKGLEQGLEQGIEQGMEQGMEHSIVRILQRRFEIVPAAVEDSLSGLTSTDLDTLLDTALLAPDLETFIRELEAKR